MKIAFPVQTDEGLGSSVYSHFGTAKIFIVADSETNETESIGNADLNHVHGFCQPLAALDGAVVDAIVVGGIGRGALEKLREAGLQVLKAVKETVNENLELFKTGELPEFEMKNICAGHGVDGECAH